jgi:hypothetical protein
MASYTLAVLGYPASESNGTYEWRVTGARGKQLAAGRGTLTGSANAAPWRRMAFSPRISQIPGSQAQTPAASTCG